VNVASLTFVVKVEILLVN